MEFWKTPVPKPEVTTVAPLVCSPPKGHRSPLHLIFWGWKLESHRIVWHLHDQIHWHLSLLHHHWKCLAAFQVSWVGAVTESISLKLISPVTLERPQEAEWSLSCLLTHGLLRAQSLPYSSPWITVQRTFNHLLNQSNWKSFSEKLPGTNSHVLY